MGWTPGILNFPEGKPKWMHWSTFYKLQLDYYSQVNKALEGQDARLSRLSKELESNAKKLRRVVFNNLHNQK